MSTPQQAGFTAATNKWAYAQAFTSKSIGHRPPAAGRHPLNRLAALRPRRAADHRVLPPLNRPIPH